MESFDDLFEFKSVKTQRQRNNYPHSVTRGASASEEASHF